MKLKSYFSGTVEAAMELARKELGDDALLVNARSAAPEARFLGDYEVVFGLGDATNMRGESPNGDSSPDKDRLAGEISNLRREFERIIQSVSNPALIAPPSPAQLLNPPQPDPRHRRLLEQELDAELANAIAAGASLEALFNADHTLGIPEERRRVVVLVGPPGAGKTTTLVKLAAKYGLQDEASCHILSSDVYRIAAADQLRSLASLLELGCDIAETPAALAQLLDQHQSKDLIFIDTPGLCFSEIEDAHDLVRFIHSRADFDTHLVLPANLHPRALTRSIELYARFGLKKLLFTRLDEAIHFGPLVSESARWSLPISFLANGQQIPDDIEPADRASIAQRFFATEHRATRPAEPPVGRAKGAAA